MGEAKQKAKKGIAVSKPAYVKLANEVAAIADIDPKLTPKKTTSQIVGAAIKKRGRPAKAKIDVIPDPVPVDIYPDTKIHPDIGWTSSAHNFTVSEPQKVMEKPKAKKQAEPDTTDLEAYLKAIHNAGALGRKRTLSVDVAAVIRLVEQLKDIKR